MMSTTRNGTFSPAVAPLSTPPGIFTRATPGPAISPFFCPIPRALIVSFVLMLEWEVTRFANEASTNCPAGAVDGLFN